jgi:pimeloyl-ACP methyl ester carboxylesterase
LSAEHRDEIDGEPVFWRSAPGAGVLYVHGVPTTSDIWAPLLDRAGGVAPDLPGFGRTTKRGDLDFTIDGYTRWLDRFAEHAGLGRCAVVTHGWGALALPWAVRHAERVVLIDPVPLLAGHRWQGLGRALRTPLLGEVAIGLTTRPALRRRLPDDVVDLVWPHFDQGTQRAILRLYRATEPDALAQPAAQLAAPALIVGDEAYAAALDAPVERAAPWEWREREDLLARIAAFVA